MTARVDASNCPLALVSKPRPVSRRCTSRRFACRVRSDLRFPALPSCFVGNGRRIDGCRKVAVGHARTGCGSMGADENSQDRQCEDEDAHGYCSLILKSRDDFALRTCVGSNGRRETDFRRRLNQGSTRASSRSNRYPDHLFLIVRRMLREIARRLSSKRARTGRAVCAPDVGLASRPRRSKGRGIDRRGRSASACVSATGHLRPARHKRTSRPLNSLPAGDGLVASRRSPASFGQSRLSAAGVSNVPHDPGEHKKRRRPREQGSD